MAIAVALGNRVIDLHTNRDSPGNTTILVPGKRAPRPTSHSAIALGITRQGNVAKWPVALRYVASDPLTPVPSTRKYLGEGRTVLPCQVFFRNPIARRRHVARNTFPTDQGRLFISPPCGFGWWASEYLDPPYVHRPTLRLVGLGVPRPTLRTSTHPTAGGPRSTSTHPTFRVVPRRLVCEERRAGWPSRPADRCRPPAYRRSSPRIQPTATEPVSGSVRPACHRQRSRPSE